MSGGDIEIKREKLGTTTILSPVGDVDLGRSPALREELKSAQRERPARLVVDLSGVPYMDSSGVATLVEALQVSRKSAINMILCGVTERVKSVFEIMRLDTVFKILGTREDALKN